MGELEPVVEYEFSVQFRGRTVALVSAVRGTPAWAVLECARQAQRELYGRECRVVRPAEANERPERWTVNPKPGLKGEIWMLVVAYEFGYPEVCDG